LKTLDVSKNNLKTLGSLATLTNLKTLHCEDNKLSPGSLVPATKLSKLQNLYCGGNQLGRPPETHPAGQAIDPLPALPASLKIIICDRNMLGSVPRSIFSSGLVKLEKLDLSNNQLAAISVEISTLKALTDLNLDSNMIVSLPDSIGLLSKLKALSLKGNKISVHTTSFSAKNPQPLPASLFSQTPLIDLNLHGNPLTSTQLNQFEGFSSFLDRREKVKTKDLFGGAMTSYDVCGLE
jgi:Leucine-rich repeat (LRR) protein